MCYIRSLLTLGVLICIFACHRTPHYPQTMLRAEQLMDTAPDSALLNEHGIPAQQMEAFYYLDSTYRDMQDVPSALEYFQKVADASVDGKEYKILSRVYNQMITLNMYQKLYDEALSV